MLYESGMRLVRSHIEQALRLSKTSGDIMAGLVNTPVVYFRKLLGVVNQEQSRCDADDRACGDTKKESVDAKERSE